MVKKGSFKRTVIKCVIVNAAMYLMFFLHELLLALIFYKYPRPVELGRFLYISIPMFLVFFIFTDVLICGAKALMRKKGILLKLVAIILILIFISQFIPMLFLTAACGSILWHSVTTDIEDYGVIDDKIKYLPVMNRRLDEFLADGEGYVESYYYDYHTGFLFSRIDISYLLRLDEEAYYSLLSKYRESGLTTEAECDSIVDAYGNTIPVSGKLIVADEETKHYRYHDFDLYFAYSDEEHIIYTKLWIEKGD